MIYRINIGLTCYRHMITIMIKHSAARQSKRMSAMRRRGNKFMCGGGFGARQYHITLFDHIRSCPHLML